jgi:hypothetical protein
MRTARRGLFHAPVCHPETDAAHRLTANGARNLEQTPDRRDNHSRDHDRKDKSNDEHPWPGTHQSSGDDKKSDRSAHSSAAAAHQVLANRHDRECYLDARRRVSAATVERLARPLRSEVRENPFDHPRILRAVDRCFRKQTGRSIEPLLREREPVTLIPGAEEARRYICTLATETDEVIRTRAVYNFIEKSMNGTTSRKIKVCSGTSALSQVQRSLKLTKRFRPRPALRAMRAAALKVSQVLE